MSVRWRTHHHHTSFVKLNVNVLIKFRKKGLGKGQVNRRSNNAQVKLKCWSGEGPVVSFIHNKCTKSDF